MLKYPNSIVLTTVSNFTLYKKTSVLFPKGIKKVVFDGTKGMHGIHSILFMFKYFKKTDIEWIVMVDEDVVFKNSNEVFNLIEYMDKNDFTVCGIRDGGVINHRNFNPYVINTFFSIVNFKKLKAIYDKKEIFKNNYTIQNEFDDDLSKLNYKYDSNSLYEPYYCFYLWLRRKKCKILFLDTEQYATNDSLANSIISLNGNLLGIHTWHARSYGKNLKHTIRIDSILGEFTFDGNSTNPEIIKNNWFPIQYNIQKLYRRLMNKIKLNN